MNESITMVRERSLAPTAEPLAERLDPAISDATTGMSVLLTDLIRRSLRGGVQKIDEELQSYVIDRVEQTLAERTPAIEQQAVEVAENAARVAATEVVVEEVRALETRTHERSEQLKTKIADVELEARTQTERKAEELAGKIGEAERRVSETTMSVLEERLEALLQKSKGTAATLRDEIRLLTEKLEESLGDVRATHGNLRDQLKSVEAVLIGQLDRHASEQRQAGEHLQRDFDSKINVLRSENAQLHARLEVLEQPRGIKAVFGKLFGSKDKP